MSEQCLELKNVCKSFRDFTLNNISFTLPQGYIMGLVGPNGAGKTTTIQLILNMLEKDAGRILAFGKDNVVSEKEIKQDIGIVFDSIFYVDSWTVKDTEKAVSIFYDNWRHDIFNDMVKRFDLPLNKKVGELSRGMQELHAAISSLPDKQAKRIYAHFILGMTKQDIARAEGVHEKVVRVAIERGLRRLEKILKNSL